MPGGGILRIITTKKDPQSVQITFQDAGIGIDENDRERIFDPFFTTKDNSSGLGLTIVRQVISEHQGEIKIESKKGQGASFIITLPLGGKDGPKA